MIELDLQLVTDASNLPAEAQLRRWVELALRQRTADSELTIRLVDPEEGRSSTAPTGTRTTPPTYCPFPPKCRTACSTFRCWATW